MRAAQATLRRPALPRRMPEPARDRDRRFRMGKPNAALLLGTVFLLGYLPGIWLGRSGTAVLGQQLAAYYANRPENLPFVSAFGAELAVSFLQLTAVLLCGFCTLGCGLLVLLFAVRGAFLGFAAASVAVQNGSTGLLQYRAATAVQDVATLLLCLWLANFAVALAVELFRTLRGSGTRNTPRTLRQLLVRYAAALVLSVGFSAVGAFLAGVLS